MNFLVILFVEEVTALLIQLPESISLLKESGRRRLNALRKYSLVEDSMDHHFESWNPFHKPKTRRYPYMKKPKQKPKIIENREIQYIRSKRSSKPLAKAIRRHIHTVTEMFDVE